MQTSPGRLEIRVPDTPHLSARAFNAKVAPHAFRRLMLQQDERKTGKTYKTDFRLNMPLACRVSTQTWKRTLSMAGNIPQVVWGSADEKNRAF